MDDKIKIGIIICNRYHACAGGKCMRALHSKEGAFSIYEGKETELVGFTTCGGCPGGNIEYAPVEMKKNNVDVIHLATGLVVGYPPCPRIDYFKDFIEEKFNIKAVIGTHPIPQKYYLAHRNLKSWENTFWRKIIQPALSDENMRIAYD